MRKVLILAFVGLIICLSAQNVFGKKERGEFDEATLFFEENTTDGDLGLHFKVDGEAWDSLELYDMKNHKLVDIKVKGKLGKVVGLTEVFSESAEPGFDEIPRADFLALFPAGEYKFKGKTIEGDKLEGTVTLTHDIPAGAVIVSPDEDEEVDADSDLVIQWQLVADPNSPSSVITHYEIVVEKDEENEPLRVFRIDMLSTDTTITVPAAFFEAGKDYKVEVIAQETSGNRSASEVSFSTAP